MRGGVFLKNDLNVKLISMEDIMEAKCCDIQEVIRVIEEVLVDYKNGGVMLPDKISQIFNLETQDRINCMPSTLMKDGVCGIKWVSVFPENPHKFSSQNVSGVIILSELAGISDCGDGWHADYCITHGLYGGNWGKIFSS